MDEIYEDAIKNAVITIPEVNKIHVNYELIYRNDLQDLNNYINERIINRAEQGYSSVTINMEKLTTNTETSSPACDYVFLRLKALPYLLNEYKANGYEITCSITGHLVYIFSWKNIIKNKNNE